jgi:putative hemolysin
LTSAAAFWLAAGALLLSAVLSTLRQALTAVAVVTLHEIALLRNRPPATARVDRIIDDLDGHATAIALPRIIANLLVVVALVAWISQLRGAAAPTWVEIVLGVAVASLLLWLFAAVIPSGIAKHAAERTVYAWSPLIRFMYVLARPALKVVRFFDEVMRRLIGDSERNDADVLQAELMSVVQEAARDGQVDQVERDMIEGVMRFKHLTVVQIMTPRTEVEALELTNDLGKLTAMIRTGGHSRIPVYEESLDHVVGIFYVKDLMKWLAGEGTRGGGKPFELKSILRPALFVPETKTVRELLAELIDKKVHIAMVADEYGGTAGLVTLEDIMEEVFGDIWDEYEPQGDEEVPDAAVDAKARTAEIDARMRIGEANDAIRPLGVDLPESEEYDTVGGYVLTALGHIPVVGETLRVGEHGAGLVTVIEAEPTRVNRVRIEVRSAEEHVQALVASDTEADARAEPQPSVRLSQGDEVRTR